jgi:hypothetical protein
MLMLDAALVSTDQPSLEQRWNRSVEVARVKTLVQHKGRYVTDITAAAFWSAPSSRVLLKPIEDGTHDLLRSFLGGTRLVGPEVGWTSRIVRQHATGMNALPRSYKRFGARLRLYVEDGVRSPGCGARDQVLDLPGSWVTL